MPTGAQVRPQISPSVIVVIISLLVLFLSRVAVVVAQEDAAPALLKFKSSLANTEPALDNWGSSTAPPCLGNHANWFGVICFNGYVWGLQLENMNLKGQIDVNSLVPLRFLRTLSFMNNSFEGVMPDWRKLGALKSLYLSNNQFSGQVPEDAFKAMNSLKKIYLSNNRFTGPIPTSLESPKLIELRLENNQFTGGIPSVSSDNLKIFNVSHNQLDGPIPPHLTNLDPSSFSGNIGLCGEPLQSCESLTPSPSPSMEPSLSPPPADAPNVQNNKSSGNPLRIIIFIIYALFLLFLLALLFLFYRRSSKSKSLNLKREMSTYGATPSNRNSVSTAFATPMSASFVTRDATEISIVGGIGGMMAEKQQQQQVGEKQQQQQVGAAGKLSFLRDDIEKFDLQDLMRASAEVLGSGNFGACYKARLVDGEALVVKRFKQMNNVEKEDFHEHMRRLGRLRHPNLLPLVSYLYRREEKLLVFRYVENGSLTAHLHGKYSEGLTWENRLKIIKGVAKGLAYLHGELSSLATPHGHLKSSNVLVDDEFNPQLMDYTLGPVVNPNDVHEILVAYKSPEYCKSGRLCKKTDVWCLGILILETLTGKLVASYFSQGSGKYNAELAGWIHAVAVESSRSSAGVFDKEMGMSSERCRPQMKKLLDIGVACCSEGLDKRLDLEEALRQIEQVHDS